MKHKKTYLFGALLAALSLTTVGGVTAMAETVSVPTPQSSNILAGLSSDAFSAKDYNGKPITQFVAGNGEGRTYTFENLNNGDSSSWDVIVATTDGSTKTLAWFNIDLGQTYVVDKLMMSMNHDWNGQDVVIQLATQADFSDAITIYNNDIDNSLGCGATFTADSSVAVSDNLSNFGSAGKSLDGNGNYFSFTPVSARYVRLTNNQYGNGALQNCTMLGEVAVYGYEAVSAPTTSAEIAPVAFSKVSGSYGEAFSVGLSSIHTDAEIYYTTDGSIPTRESNQYTAPIAVELNKTVMIRAAAYVNGVMGTPVTATYVSQDAAIGTNVALNKPVKVMNSDMTEDWSDSLHSTNKPDEKGANAVTRINDGSFDMWYCVDTSEHMATGWAIIDFGAEYYIDYVVYEAYHDWWMANNVIEISTTENFTKETTTRIYYNLNGIQTGVASGNKGMQIDANVKGRYLRVSNDKEAGGTISAFTEIQAFVGKEPEEGSLVGANVAKGKDITFMSYDMSEDWSDKLYAVNSSDKEGANTVDHINDGSFDFWYALTSQTAGGKGWAIIDLGEEYYIDYLVYDAYHDWDVANHIIKIASESDYSDAVTVHENAASYQTGGGKTIDANVKGRYILVSNSVSRDETDNVEATVLTEIQAFVGEEPNAEEALYLASYDTFENITVDNGTAWTDIELPTELTVKMSDGSTRTVSGSCAMPEGYAGKGGTYTTAFKVEDETLLLDVFGIYKDIEITVTVRKVQPTISLSVADRIVCDGNAPTVEVTASMDYTVEYYKGSVKLDAAPTTAGEYKVVVSIAETSDNDAASKEATFIMVDYRALNEKLAEVAKLSETKYMSAGWSALMTEKTSAQAIADDEKASQTQIDAALEGLTTAVAALQEKGDTTALQEKYDAVKDTVNVYTQASWMRFTEALAEAEDVLEEKEVAQATADAALEKLTTNYGALVAKADFSALQTAVNVANALTLDNYVSAGKADFEEALTAAEAVLANDETAQADIDAAKTALDTKQAALVLKGDKTALNTALESANYAPTNYTATSYNAYTVAKEAAEAVVENADATQADVDEAKTALETAIAGLKALGNKTALKNAIDTAKALTETDYTAESWAQLQTAITYAETVKDSNDVMQADVDEAVTLLTQAQDALVLVKSEDESGCGSSLAGSALAVMSALGVGVLLRKKKED